MKIDMNKDKESEKYIESKNQDDLILRIRYKLQNWGVSDNGVRALTTATTALIDRNTKAEDVLSEKEVNYLWEINRGKREHLHWNGPSNITLIMKSTRLCNLRCTYCHAWREGPNNTMSFEVAARTFLEFFGDGGPCEINVVWHGGEVTALKASEIRKLLWLQSQLAGSYQIVRNALQTNGYRISNDWMRLIKRYDISVGVSIDGVKFLHDKVRRTLTGKPTFDAVLSTVKKLRKQGTSVGFLLVVTKDIIDYGAKNLLRDLHAYRLTNLALLNEIPDARIHELTAWDNYVPFDEFVIFLEQVYDVWNRYYRDLLKIRELEAFRKKLDGKQSGICTIDGNCMGRYLTINPDGKISACDKYVGDEGYDFGYVHQRIVNLEENTTFHAARQEAEEDILGMSKCQYFSVCQGGCPHDNRTTRLFKKEVGRSCCGLAPLLKRIQATEENRNARATTD